MAFIQEVDIFGLHLFPRAFEGHVYLRRGRTADGELFNLSLRESSTGQVYGERTFADGSRQASLESMAGVDFTRQGGIRRGPLQLLRVTWTPQPQAVAMRAAA